MNRRRLCLREMAAGSQERIRAELRLAREQQRVHGAYLFEGPPGSGMRESAHWFARLLLFGALFVAAMHRRLTWTAIQEAAITTLKASAMVCNMRERTRRILEHGHDEERALQRRLRC